MNQCITTIFAFFLLISCSFANDGMPFGKITGDDVVNLTKFAKSQGVDLGADGKKMYKKDKEALSRIFKLSIAFKSLDQNARTYGQVIYSSLLNLAESMGIEEYSKIVTAQSPEVKQRIRDFLYYSLTKVPKKDRKQVEKEIRSDFPILFPADYEFGKNDPIFKEES